MYSIPKFAKALGYDSDYRLRAPLEQASSTQNEPMGASQGTETCKSSTVDLIPPYRYLWTPNGDSKRANDDCIASETLPRGKRRRIDFDDDTVLGSPSKRQKPYDEDQDLRMGRKRRKESDHEHGSPSKHRRLDDWVQNHGCLLQTPNNHAGRAKTLADPKIAGTLFRISVAEVANTYIVFQKPQ